eukprot:9492804-Alexandrium_andersonii.AAC.1
MKQRGGPENPQKFPELVVSDMSLADEAAQWASEIMPGADEFYLCRQRACVTACRDAGWATADKNGGGHCRRPSCAERYCPWKDQHGYTEANK